MDPTLAFVIAHFHPRGVVATHLYELVRHLATLTARVIFVSTGLLQEEGARLRPYARVIVRENIGYDFWSYKTGIDALGRRSDLQRLVLCNSSFITLDPKSLCRAFLTPVAERQLRGLTTSAEGETWHAQSYWVAFENSALISSPDFERWWAEMVPISNRAEVIRRYELGMSARFASIGVPIKGLYVPSMDELLLAACRALESRHWKLPNPPRFVTLDLEQARALNPTHFLWDEILHRFGVIKLELLTRNPHGLNLMSLFARAKASPQLHALIKDATSN